MFRLTTAFLTFALSLNLGAQESSEEVPLPASMGAFGDSITAGMLANFYRYQIIFPWVQAYLWGEVLVSGGGRNMDVIERKHLSWSTGIDPERRVASHAKRLTLLNEGRELKIFNAAVSGAASIDLESQHERLREWSYKHLGTAAPDYLTVLMGPNDVCANSPDEMTPTYIYKARMEKLVQDILSESANSRILLSTVPNIERLRQVAIRAPLFAIGPLGRCEGLWKLAKICPTLTTLSSPQDRAAVAARVDDFNAALKEIAESHSKIFGDRVRVAEETFQSDFDSYDLSIDCFHPNPVGQQKISDASWKSAWWAKTYENQGPALERAERDRIRDEERRRRQECLARQNPRVPRAC